MGAQNSDQRLELMLAGVASAGLEWRGGEGIAVIYGGTIPADPGVSMQMSPDNGATWVAVHMYGANDTAHVEWLVANGADAKNFKLPACRLRASVAVTSMNMLAVSV